MRYQGVDSEILHHHPSNGKKPHLKIFSKDNNLENGGRDSNKGSSEGKFTFNLGRINFKGGSSSMRSPDDVSLFKEQEYENGNENKNILAEPFQKSNEGCIPPRALKEGGDILLQWKKRPRAYKPESRSIGEDSSMPSRKILRNERQATKPEKQKVPVESQVIANSRSMTLRASTPHREAQFGSNKRNWEGMNGTHLNSDLCQKIDMHLSARHDKHDKTVSCFSPNTFGNGTVNDAMVCNSTPSDVEAHAPPEKVNMETFEWPRILLQLSRKEKEDDFLAMKGTKLSQRPKKRPKNVERVLQVTCLRKNSYQKKKRKASTPTSEGCQLLLNPTSTPTSGVNPASYVGNTVTGCISGKFRDGYFITVVVGSEKLNGILYHVGSPDGSP